MPAWWAITRSRSVASVKSPSRETVVWFCHKNTPASTARKPARIPNGTSRAMPRNVERIIQESFPIASRQSFKVT